MKKIIFAIFFILNFAGIAIAEERSEQEIINAAKQVLIPSGLHNRISINGEISILRKDEQLSVVGYEDGRLVFIANDDLFDAVLGYTDEPVTGELPPAMKWWMKAMNESLATYLINGKALKDSRPAPVYSEAIEPMITTKWDQGTPYNNLCPEYKENNIKKRYVTGCVATAMSQVMNYHQWPIKGKSSHSYYLYDENGTRTRLYANFGNTTYDWANMLDVYNKNATYTTEQAKAVSTLMYHCGVAVDMSYAKDGSGAYTKDASIALKKYFDYHQDIRTYYREVIHVDEWMDMVYREINDKCPILYGGSRNDGGHAFVLDGYNASGKVHVNWGWSGSGDGYFDIAKLDGYTQMQELIIVRKPDDTRYSKKFASTWGLLHPLTAKLVLNKITLSTTGLASFCEENFNGYIGIMVMDTITKKAELLGKYEQKISDFPYGYGYSQFSVSASLGNLKDGTYRVYLGSLDDKDTEWQAVRSKEDVCNSYILVKEGAQATLTAEKSSKWIYDIITSIDEIENTSNNEEGTIRVYDLSGKQVYVSDVKKFQIDNIPATGVLIIRNGSLVKKIIK